MVSIEVKVWLEEIYDVLNTMREWIDHNKIIAHFLSSRHDADGIVTMRVGFTQDDDRAEAFRRRFGANGAALR